MKVEYAIPTLNRATGLERLLATVDAPISVWEEVEPRALPKIYHEMLLNSDADVCVILADHLELEPGFREAVEDAFDTHFPDTDGVVGVNRVNLPSKVWNGIRLGDYGHVAIGRAFMDRFPDRQCHCPDYYHFGADTELGLYAESVDRFVFNHEAKCFTHSPNVSKKPMDQTYHDSRIHREHDMETLALRRERGLLWGESFELVNEPGVFRDR